ncbi:AbgT family transporter [Nocardia arthritidis]|uniref:p-aminobenzoyl-glutamate transporter n=1 Tax=Nocardia arthritidis TaxID=228602 RepID=A0A6G9YCJ9_9NOCA|nr:AbgT family transporter [Nocardia arthritidis]QIS11005.1 p-aminobenzoyl-glutamate transporter [Nocardia arthritidis]
MTEPAVGTPTIDTPTNRQTSVLQRALASIERVGNKLPHPFWLFVILTAVVVLASWLLATFNVSAITPGSGKRVEVRNLISGDGLHMMIGDLIKNYVNFPPLGLIVVVMLGVAVADKTGLLAALMRASLARVPARYVSLAVAVVCMFAQVAADAAFVVMIPLAMVAFRAVGRSPVLGAVVAFVAVGGAHNISPVLIPADPVFAGIATSAAHTIDPSYVVTPTSNYYFSVVSSLVLAVTIAVVTELVVARRVAVMNAEEPESTDAEELPDMSVSALEIKGMRWALASGAIFLVALALAVLPYGSPLRGKGGAIVNSPLMEGVAVFLMFFFIVIGTVYGIVIGKIRTSRDLPDMMVGGLKELAPVLVLFFTISQFLAYFQWTNLGSVISIHGAELLKNIGASPVLIFIGVVLLVSAMTLLLTSGSAMWALVAPILVPMLMLLHIHPETTMALFRIANAPVHSITPMSPYFVMALGFIRRYRPTAGIGTLMSLVLPLAVVDLVVWLLIFLAWYWLGIPLGPGAPVS